MELVGALQSGRSKCRWLLGRGILRCWRFEISIRSAKKLTRDIGDYV